MFDRIKNLDYLTFSTNEDYLNFRIFCQGRYGIIRRILSYFYGFFLSLKKFKFKLIKSDVVFIYSTDNQKRSLELIQDEYKSRHGVQCGISYSLKNKVNGELNFPEVYSYIISLFFLPLVFIESTISILFKKDYKKYAHGLDRYILSFGQYCIYYFFLSIIKPRLIVLSNDHNSEIRAIISLAKKKKIKTLYIQHASPNINLPPLEQFDICLLDGQASLDIYNQVGKLSKEVELVGIAKLDKFKKIKPVKNKSKFISIALNASFEINSVKNLIRIINSHGHKVRVRMHPGQVGDQDKIMNMIGSLDVIYNDPRKDDLFDFILSSKILIAGNSNIILEAAILGVPTCYAVLADSEYDYYGFVRDGITTPIDRDFSDITNVFHKVLNFKPKLEKIKYYDHSVGESYFGQSSLVICDYIDRVI